MKFLRAANYFVTAVSILYFSFLLYFSFQPINSLSRTIFDITGFAFIFISIVFIFSIIAFVIFAFQKNKKNYPQLFLSAINILLASAIYLLAKLFLVSVWYN